MAEGERFELPEAVNLSDFQDRRLKPLEPTLHIKEAVPRYLLRLSRDGNAALRPTAYSVELP